MTAPDRLNPLTEAALQAVISLAFTDQLLNRLHNPRDDEDDDTSDIDQTIINALGITACDRHGYHIPSEATDCPDPDPAAEISHDSHPPPRRPHRLT